MAVQKGVRTMLGVASQEAKQLLGISEAGLPDQKASGHQGRQDLKVCLARARTCVCMCVCVCVSVSVSVSVFVCACTCSRAVLSCSSIMSKNIGYALEHVTKSSRPRFTTTATNETKVLKIIFDDIK